MRLGPLSWPRLEATAPVLLLPLGATEQHGPHLPLATDTVIATAVADAVADRRAGVLAAPPLPYGASGEHEGFPGTLSLGVECLELALVELVRSADHFEAVVLVSWHGGNAEPVAQAVRRLCAEGRRVEAWRPRRIAGGDLHAGRTETSLMLWLAPELVGDRRPAEATLPAGELLPVLRERGVRAVSASGVLGDATGATAREGAALFEQLVADLGRLVDELTVAAAS